MHRLLSDVVVVVVLLMTVCIYLLESTLSAPNYCAFSSPQKRKTHAFLSFTTFHGNRKVYRKRIQVTSDEMKP
jgi:hypothetical protein